MAGLKRKRSDSELSFSSSSTLSSPPRPNSFAFSAMMMHTNHSPMALSRSNMPTNIHSRTLKRLRNNRPSEVDVHQHTLDLLYSAAQTQHQNQEISTQLFQNHHIPVQEPQPRLVTSSQPAVSNQPSLHSFWGQQKQSFVPTASSPAVSDSMLATAATNCEDCGAGLGVDEDTMAVDGCSDTEERCCSVCSKPVCFSCSVSNLGEQKRCLMCAGRGNWAGGM